MKLLAVIGVASGLQLAPPLRACTASARPLTVSMNAGKCPVPHGFMSGFGGTPKDSKMQAVQAPPAPAATNTNWWPDTLNLKVLSGNDPTREGYSYAAEFAKLDLEAVKQDVFDVMKTSQDWWPADYGHYGPLFIRLAWHSAGTYRIFDGRGGGSTGNQRFAPLNSWPDNANLDKARRLLWPVKAKYGRALSWGDLMIFAGNCALEDMGLQPFGFAGGREDVWEPEEDIYWGQETEWLDDKRHGPDGGLGEDLDKPLGAVQMGLIYVNPEGPGAVPDPARAAEDIRATFGRMAMDDEETVALIAGGHTFGKAHGAGDASVHVGPEPEGASIQEQGFGWTSNLGSGKGVDTITSGLEGAWTQNPIVWDNAYFDNLFGFEWEQTKSPGGATQWAPKDGGAAGTVPDAHDPSRTHSPMMFTTDLALRTDPAYTEISKRFHENPDQFADAFARAWYKLTHRDMGPVTRLLGNMVPEAQVWQDPVPAPKDVVSEAQVSELKATILKSGISTAQLVRTAWASASTYRMTDHRGGANGARLRLAPQKDWAANDPAELAEVLSTLEGIQEKFNKEHAGGSLFQKAASVSLADLIVLGGCAAIEAAASAGGHAVKVPFSPGRGDATLEQTDVSSFDVLEPTTDGFRNYVSAATGSDGRTPEALLVDKANMLRLSAPEMTVLVGGMRALGANAGGSSVGVFTETPGTLTNDFFVNLLALGTTWVPTDNGLYEGLADGGVKWTGSQVDLIFGSDSRLRAIAEYYGSSDSKQVFVEDFVAAWAKVMNLDRFDL